MKTRPLAFLLASLIITGVHLIPGSLRAEEKINLWPLFYKTPEKTVILWPIFEKRDRSLAIRPFLKIYDKNRYSVLLGLGGYNRIQVRHWFYPIYSYRKSEHLYVIPFGGKGKNWRMILPPLYYGAKEHYYINGEAVPALRTDILWPVLKWTRGQGVRQFRLFPLFGYKRVGPIHRWFALGPLANSKTNMESKKHRSWVLPFYYRSYKPDSRMFITLFGGTGTHGHDKWLSVLGPLYIHKRGPNTNILNLAWPIFQYKNTQNSQGKRLFPIFFDYRRQYEENRDERWTAIVPLFHFCKQSDGTTCRSVLWPLYYHEQKPDGRTSTNVLWRLADYTANKNNVRFRILWHLFRYEKKDSTLEVESLPFLFYTRRPDLTRFSFFWKLFEYRREKEISKLSLFFIPIRKWKNSSRQSLIFQKSTENSVGTLLNSD